MITKARGLLALVGLAAILLGLPWLLLAVAHIGTPRFGWTLQALLSPDDGTLAFTLLKLVGWIVWMILTVAIGIELWAQLRRRPAPRLRGLRLPQHFARQMVGSAAALFVATAPFTIAAPSLAGSPAPGHAQQAVPRQHPGDTHPQSAPTLTKHSVATYTVKKGDTLSAIALAKTGRAANYPRIFDASKSIRQPGGRHLVDPDEIDIGWTLKIPKAGTSRDTSQREKTGHRIVQKRLHPPDPPRLRLRPPPHPRRARRPQVQGPPARAPNSPLTIPPRPAAHHQDGY